MSGPNAPKKFDTGAALIMRQTSDDLDIGHSFADSSGAPDHQLDCLKVSLHKRPNDSLFVLVELLSLRQLAKGNKLWSRRAVELHQRSESDIMKEIGITAGALAEYQSEVFGDKHDPIQCEKLAKEAFVEMVKDLESQGARIER